MICPRQRGQYGTRVDEREGTYADRNEESYGHQDGQKKTPDRELERVKGHEGCRGGQHRQEDGDIVPI